MLRYIGMDQRHPLSCSKFNFIPIADYGIKTALNLVLLARPFTQTPHLSVQVNGLTSVRNISGVYLLNIKIQFV